MTEYLTPVATPELFELFQNYQMFRHSGGEMALMDYSDFRGMFETSPIKTSIKTYRLEVSRELIGAVLLDDQVMDIPPFIASSIVYNPNEAWEHSHYPGPYRRFKT